MKITRTKHGKAGSFTVGDATIPIVEWSAEFEVDGRWWNPKDVFDWTTSNVTRLTRNARRLLRKERGRRP